MTSDYRHLSMTVGPIHSGIWEHVSDVPGSQEEAAAYIEHYLHKLTREEIPIECECQDGRVYKHYMPLKQFCMAILGALDKENSEDDE